MRSDSALARDDFENNSLPKTSLPTLLQVPNYLIYTSPTHSGSRSESYKNKKYKSGQYKTVKASSERRLGTTSAALEINRT